MRKNKWNAWLFKTSSRWSEDHLELPVLDHNHVNLINNAILLTIFNIHKDAQNLTTDLTPKNCKHFETIIENASMELSKKLEEKEFLVKKINERRISQYIDHHKEVKLTMQKIKKHFTNGRYNQCSNIASMMLINKLDQIENIDRETFKLDNLLNLNDFSKKENLLKHISLCQFPSVKTSQLKAIDSLTELQAHYNRKSNDYFTLEELSELLKSNIKRMINEENNIIDRFEIKQSNSLLATRSAINKSTKDICEKIVYRADINKELLHNLNKSILTHINQTVYHLIATNKISLDYFIGINNVEQINNLFLLTDEMGRLAKILFENTLKIFAYSDHSQKNRTNNLMECSDMLSRIIELQVYEQNFEKVNYIPYRKKNILENIDKFKNKINEIQEYEANKSPYNQQEYKSTLLRLLTLILLEVSNA